MDTEDFVVSGIITSSSAISGSVTVATISSTVAAPGIAGWLGFTTTATTVVSLPVAGIVATGGLLCYGAYKVYKAINKS